MLNLTPDKSRVLSVLLVEDADDEREMYAQSLRMRGYQTLQARNADEGLRLASERLPVVIVTDVVLSGSMNGFMLTQALKQDPRTRHTPVIILTGRVFEADREAAAHVGCDLFLTKPCLPDELVRSVRRCAAASRLARIRGRAVSAELLGRVSPPRKAENG
jgi:CheY-like chemotaxis protein